ncbi:MAG: hypothetical protein K2Z80_09590 [Xanthobacteraceae bacterium]|nr:hypothetical protein [Xanthobacteraceae bacterium]
MRKGALLACIGVALLQAGCSILDATYIREGIGTNLSSAELVEVTNLQDLYVGEICRQAGLRITYRGDEIYCDEVNLRPHEWATFVQAGMNDIDRRCDAYLAWLDNKRRWREPILKQLATTAATTAVLMGVTGASAKAISIAAAAFGLAQDTFVNFNARLITEIDNHVVQSVVLGNQTEYRLRIVNGSINNRPAAIYLLRNYLRICMPFSIEMSISNTVTVYQRGGPDALRTDPLLQRPPTVARETAIKPDDPVSRRERPVLETLKDYEQIIERYKPEVHTIAKIEPVLKKICVPEAELRAIGDRAKLAVQIYQHAANKSDRKLLRTVDLTKINDLKTACPQDRLNYFEAWMLKGAINSKENIETLNAGLAENRKIRTDVTVPVPEVRSRIAELRNSLAANLKLKSPLLIDQLTADLMEELVVLQMKQKS